LVKILVIGDTHIPERAHEIPRQILDMIGGEHFDFVLCTGDLTDERVKELFARLGKLYVVRGNMDFLNLPQSAQIEADGFTLGLIHGDTVYPRGDERELAKEAQKRHVDILISGHTHRLAVSSTEIERRKVLLIDPGSATGVWGGGPASGIPSFVILEIKRNQVIVTSFELVGESLRKSKYVFEKI